MKVIKFLEINIRKEYDLDLEKLIENVKISKDVFDFCKIGYEPDVFYKERIFIQKLQAQSR